MYRQLIFKSLTDTLYKYRKIVIVSHVNPDGDALGSSLALHLFAKKVGIDSQVIIPNDYPNFLSWLPSINDIIAMNKDSAKQAVSLRTIQL